MKFFLHFIFIPFSLIFTALPRSTQWFLAKILGCIWFDVLRVRRQMVINHLSLAFPDWPLDKKVSVGRKSVQHLCYSFLEYMILVNYRQEDRARYFEVTSRQHIDDQLAKGKGALLVSLHLGSIDLAVLGFASLGFRINITSKEIRNEVIAEFVQKLRARFNIVTLKDRRNPFLIFRALKDNEAVIFIMDQFMGAPHGIPVKFFGHKAWTAAGLAAFAIKTEQRVIPIYNFRRDDGMVVIGSLDPIELEVGPDREQNIKVMTQKYNDALEKIIRMHPEQWLWLHRRWKE